MIMILLSCMLADLSKYLVFAYRPVSFLKFFLIYRGHYSIILSLLIFKLVINSFDYWHFPLYYVGIHICQWRHRWMDREALWQRFYRVFELLCFRLMYFGESLYIWDLCIIRNYETKCCIMIQVSTLNLTMMHICMCSAWFVC